MQEMTVKIDNAFIFKIDLQYMEDGGGMPTCHNGHFRIILEAEDSSKIQAIMQEFCGIPGVAEVMRGGLTPTIDIGIRDPNNPQAVAREALGILHTNGWLTEKEARTAFEELGLETSRSSPSSNSPSTPTP